MSRWHFPWNKPSSEGSSMTMEIPKSAYFSRHDQETLRKNSFHRAMHFLQPCLSLSQLRARLVGRYGTLEAGGSPRQNGWNLGVPPWQDGNLQLYHDRSMVLYSWMSSVILSFLLLYMNCHIIFFHVLYIYISNVELTTDSPYLSHTFTLDIIHV